MFGQCMRWIKRWDPRSPRPAPLAAPASPSASASALAALEEAPRKQIECRGHADGWLRILSAVDLLELVQSSRAMEAMWRQSRLSSQVWRRDLQPAVQRYAEYVQLMPASESHHHAHVGGLLAHTLEMTLAAMTWRNGHFFPEGAPVEEMDAQRDEWTYVVFFAALLHDVGKIMTDLRVSWICGDMDSPLRWVPMTGPLTEMAQHRIGGEYLVEFTPKSARDYQAHSKLSMGLLQQIAPPSALSFLARRPLAFDSLAQYLSGCDKTSLLATLIRKADQTSTQQALTSGSRARFATSTSVPLIDLLMQSIKDMLRSGTALPLNRSGAAGWVYEGAIWFVAKRLADGVRQHIKLHHPEESIPGENKNDRLFDTWQEYGCIQLNPHSGQAVWYVQVHGESSTGASAGGLQGHNHEDKQEEGGATYSHSLTMLRFPLDKLFPDADQYPPVMVGRIEIQQKRVATSTEQAAGAILQPQGNENPDSAPTRAPDDSKPQAGPKPVVEHTGAVTAPSTGSKGFRDKSIPALRAPAFNRTKAVATKLPKVDVNTKGATHHKVVTAPPSQPVATDFEPLQMGGPDGFNAKNKWLDFEDDAALFKEAPKAPQRAEAPPASANTSAAKTTAPIVPIASKPATTTSPKTQVKAESTRAELPPMPEPPDHRPLLSRTCRPSMTDRSDTSSSPRIQHAPVVLTPFLPELPHESAGKQVEPTTVALAFVTWLQQGLASRDLKYNETGAMIHFTAEGMALVSPLVFKAYVANHESVNDSEAEAKALQVQREVIKASWHLLGPGKSNILKYHVLGRGGVPVGKLSAVVLIRPERWVMPVPPSNPVLHIA
ncbi:integrating conjugative element relaxase, PFGI-1 class [Hydrogenophaga sp. T4]|nr:integrating conjugative element relaxase, PFGI-1 class [Hydrogenophaga sp. T4]